jgi:cell division protein ZapA (FtsZ GTPase activity inhibitor)
VTGQTHRVEFEILGQKITIRSEATPEYVHRLVAYLEDRLQEVGGDGADALRRLALVALYVTDELFRLRDERSQAEGDVNARVDALLKLLEDTKPASPRADGA